MDNTIKRNAGSMVASLLVGSVIGAAVGILIAPASGEKTRRMIKNRVDDIQTKGQMAFKDAQGRVLDLVSDVSGEVQDRAAKLKKIGRKVVKQQRDSLKHGVKEVKDVLQT